MAGPGRTREDVIAELAARPDRGAPRFRERTFRHAPEPSAKPAPRPTNGGPKVYGSPLEELEDIGKTLYFPDAWIPRLASDIGERPRMLRKWITGERKMPELALIQARAAIRRHIARMEKLLVRLGEDPREPGAADAPDGAPRPAARGAVGRRG